MIAPANSAQLASQEAIHGSHLAQCPRDRERGRHDRHRHRQGPHRRHPAAARSRRRDARPRRAPGDAGLHRDPHPPRQVAHPGALQGRARRPRGGDRRGRQAEEVVHRRGRLQQGEAHPGEGHPQRHHAHAHATRGRPRHRLARAGGRAAADRGVQVGDRSGDLHLPAGGPAQQSRHRRADARGPEERRIGGRRRALHRQEPARPDRPHLRHRPRVRHRYRHAPRFRRRPPTISISSTCASWPSASSGAAASPSAT